MAINKVILEVTERITHRSRETRSKYPEYARSIKYGATSSASNMWKSGARICQHI